MQAPLVEDAGVSKSACSRRRRVCKCFLGFGFAAGGEMTAAGARFIAVASTTPEQPRASAATRIRPADSPTLDSDHLHISRATGQDTARQPRALFALHAARRRLAAKDQTRRTAQGPIRAGPDCGSPAAARPARQPTTRPARGLLVPAYPTTSRLPVRPSPSTDSRARDSARHIARPTRPIGRGTAGRAGRGEGEGLRVEKPDERAEEGGAGAPAG